MLRNLLYSICLHLFAILLFYVSGQITVPVDYRNNSINTSIDLQFLDHKTIREMEKAATKNSKVPNLSLNDKIALYNRTKALEKELGVKNVGDKGIGKMVSSAKEDDKEVSRSVKNQMIALENIKNKEILMPKQTRDGKVVIIDDVSNSNVVTKDTHKVYVGEDKLTEEQVQKIKETEKIKADIRKVLPENSNVKLAKPETLKEALNNLDKPIEIYNKDDTKTQKKVDNKKSSDDRPVVAIAGKSGDTQNLNNTTANSTDGDVIDNAAVAGEGEEEQLYVSEVDDLLDILAISNLNEKVKNLAEVNSENIFTKEDIDIMKERSKNDNLSSRSGLYQLSLREKADIQKQIRYCYKNAIIQSKKNSNIVISVNVELFKDGRINMKQVNFKVLDSNRKNITKEEYDIALDNAKLALVYCNPIRNLPIGKYHMWKNMNFVFDSIN